MARGSDLDVEMRIIWEKSVCCFDGMHGRARERKARKSLKAEGMRCTDGNVGERVAAMLDAEFDEWARKKKLTGFYYI